MDPFDLEPEHPSWMPNGRYCVQCDTDTHVCPGCGAPIRHGEYACAECQAIHNDEHGVSGYEL